jgi:hypothetical protein
MDVPAEKERRVTAKGYGANEVLPSGLNKEADEKRLQ